MDTNIRHSVTPRRCLLFSFFALVFLVLVCGSARAQGWIRIGSLPKPPTLATDTYEPSNAQPFWRGWQKPVYDPVDKKLLVYLANPPCCYGTFSNALFFYDSKSNTWSLAWSHMTETNTGGPADAPNAPADRHPYHWVAWDSTRNVLWTGFGSAQVGGTSGDCVDCGVSDLYKFDGSKGQGVWTELCGNGAAPCPPGRVQEGAAAYDPSVDAIVIYGGLVGGTATGDTWLYYPANNSWKKLCGSCGPPALNGHSMVSIGAGKIVMFGGMSGASGLQNRTWIFNTSTKKWTKVNSTIAPPATKFPPMDYDPAIGKVILIGRESGGAHVWAFDPVANQWTDLNIPVGPTLNQAASQSNSGAFDPAANRFVLFTHQGYPDRGTIWTLSLSGSEELSGPGASRSPGGVAFGNQKLRTTDPARSVTPFSSRTSAVSISSRTISGTNSGDFAPSNNCPASLATNSKCAINGVFTPSGAAAESVSRIISDTADSPQSVALADSGTRNDGGNRPLYVPLTIQEAIYTGISGLPRSQDPVTVGIPLPDSAGIDSVSQLGLSGASLGQFRALGRWPSGNVKWLLVDTQADVRARRQNTGIALTTGTGNFGGSDLTTDNGATITVNTGTATFTIKKANFNLIDQALVNGRTLVASGSSMGLVVVGPAPGSTTCPCSTVYSSSNDPNSAAVIEENGPVRAVIKATGQHKDASGNAYMRYTVRLNFYKNRNSVKVVSQLQNADYGTSNSFVSAYKGFSAYEARLTPTLGSGRSFSFGTSSSPVKGSFAASENAYLYQAYSNNMESTCKEDASWNAPSRRPELDLRSYIARTLVTNASCQTVWSYSQEGYQIIRGSSTIATGSRSQYPEGWADLQDSSGAGIEIGIYQMSAYWPKSLQFMSGGSEVRIGIWPDQSLFLSGGGQPYFQSWPQYSIHTLYINFHSSALSNPSAEFGKFQYHLIARAPRVQYSDSAVLPFALIDPTEEDNYYKSLGMYCCTADNSSPKVYRYYSWPAGGGGNQTEHHWADLMLWIQRGYTGRYLNASHFYRFLTEQGFPRSDYNAGIPFHWRDGSVLASDLDSGGFPSNISSLNNDIGCDPGEIQCGRNWIDHQHAHWYGMIDYYFMTGDESIKDAIQAGASDKFGNPKIGFVQKGLYWAPRNIGEALMSDARLFHFYSAIGDSVSAGNALAAGDLVLQNQVWPDLQASGFGTSPQGVSRVRGVQYGCCGVPRRGAPFEYGILNEGLWEYLQAHGTSWPMYQQTFDLAYGIADFTLTEAWRKGPFIDGCHGGTGTAYEVMLDQRNPDLVAGCNQTVWFNFYIAAKYTGDPGAWDGWKAKFPLQLKREAGGHGLFDEYGTIFISTMVNEVLHPQPTTLVTVPVTVTNAGGTYQLSWTVPTGALSYRLKYSNKNIVDWLNFDPATNTFGLEPNANVPWFAATDAGSVPAPAATGSIQTYTMNGLDPAKAWHFVIKAYVKNVTLSR
jgi:YetA-like protein/Galactose oxidase, central domain